ncbi:signaling lymphocytic activation molecule-like [Xenopus tropicalis]|nr:signaling lymphocytic activation molecule-like [Xenopus tropicalis]
MCAFICLLFLLSLHYGSTDYNGHDKEYETIEGTIGKPLDLPANITKPNQKHWLRKMMDDGRRKKILQYDPQNKNKSVFDADLFRFNVSKMEFEIVKVQREHEGRYIITEDGDTEFDLAKYYIKVYEQISRVSIGLAENPINESCVITLNCTTQEGDHVMYNWSQNQKYLKHNSSVLQVTLSPSTANVSYTCRASNPVSQGVSSITPLVARCSTTPEERWDTLLIVVLAILLPALVLLVLIGKYIQVYCATEKGSFSLDPQRPHPVPGPVPEPVQTTHTVYATVQKGSFSLDPQRPHPVPGPVPEPVQTTHTVYATVQKVQAPVNLPTTEHCTIYELAGPVGNQSHQTTVP